MWGDPGYPGHPMVEAHIDETLQRAVESETCTEQSGGFTRRRAKFRTEKWLFDNSTLALVFCVPLILILIIEHLLVDPRGLFIGP